MADASDASFPMSPQDRDIAIRTMMGEEGDPMGQAGVAATMINRARTGQYGGKTLSSVALAPGQFEPWKARPNDLWAIPTNDPGYLQAGQILDGVASGALPDPTGGATHFYAPAAQKALGRKPPAWDNGSGVPLGKTLFFSPNGPASSPASQAISKAGANIPSADPLADYAPTAPTAKAVAPADPLADYSTAVAAPKAAPTPTGAPSLPAKPAAAAPAPPASDPLADFTTAGAERPYPGPPSFSALSAAAAGNPDNIDTTKPPATRFFGLLRAEPDYTTPAPVRPISNYLLGQAKGAVAEAPQDFWQGATTAARGAGEIAQGNVLPSFHGSIDPRTWSAGGALTTAGGLAGVVFSPLTVATNKFVSEPVNLLTGGPQTVQETNLFGTPTGNSITYDPGERAGLVANLLAGGGLGTKAAEAGAAVTPTARAAAGFRSLLGDTPPPELVNRFAQNPDLRLMDDPRARAILQGAATTPGTKAFNILSKSAEESDAAAPSAVSGAFDAAMGPTPNVQKLLADLDQKTKDNAKKAYGDAFAGAKPVDISPVVDMLSKIESPGVMNLKPMNQAEMTASASTTGYNHPTVPIGPAEPNRISGDARSRWTIKQAPEGLFEGASPILAKGRPGQQASVANLPNIETTGGPGVNSVVSMPSGIPPSVRQQTATNLKSLLTDENGSVLRTRFG